MSVGVTISQSSFLFPSFSLFLLSSVVSSPSSRPSSPSLPFQVLLFLAQEDCLPACLPTLPGLTQISRATHADRRPLQELWPHDRPTATRNKIMPCIGNDIAHGYVAEPPFHFLIAVLWQFRERAHAFYEWVTGRCERVALSRQLSTATRP